MRLSKAQSKIQGRVIKGTLKIVMYTQKIALHNNMVKTNFKTMIVKKIVTMILTLCALSLKQEQKWLLNQDQGNLPETLQESRGVATIPQVNRQ